VSSYILRCAIACVKFHVEGENVLFGIILFSCIVTHPSTFLLCAVNCLACVDWLRRGFGSLRFHPCSEVAVRLTSLMLFHLMYVAWSFAADSTNKFNKAFIRSLHNHKVIKLLFTANKSTLYTSYYDKYRSFCDRVFTCFHYSSVRLNRHFFLISLKWWNRPILLYFAQVFVGNYAKIWIFWYFGWLAGVSASKVVT